MSVELPKQIISDWINLWAWTEKHKGVFLCLRRGAGVTCGQIISNELCKSPQRNAGWQWVMLTTPSQWDYMNIFIAQQKSKGESEAGIFPQPRRPVHLYWWHVRLIFEFSSLGLSSEMLCVVLSWQLCQILLKGVQAKLKAGWSLCQAGNPFVLHHVSVWLFFFLLFSTFPPLCQCDVDGEGGAGAEGSRIDFTSCPQPDIKAERYIYIYF